MKATFSLSTRFHRLARQIEEILYPAMEDFGAQHCGWQARSTLDAVGGEAVHAGRRDHPIGTVEFAAARPLRATASIIWTFTIARNRPRSCADRRALLAFSSTTTERMR